MKTATVCSRLFGAIFSREVLMLAVVAGMIFGNNIYSRYNGSRPRPKARSVQQLQMEPCDIPIPEVELDGTVKQAHLDAANEWMDSAEEVALKTDDTRAQRTLEFIRSYVAPSAPVPAGATSVGPTGKGQSLAWLVPVLPSDERIVPWQAVSMSLQRFGGMYNPATSFIIVNPFPMSRTWMGLTLLNQGEQARVYTSERYNFQDPRINYYRIRDAYEFQQELATKLGGAPYQRLLREEVERQRKVIAMNKAPVGDFAPDRGPYHADLDTILGPAASDFERDFREWHLWTHAAFTLIDEEFVGDKEDKKALYLLAASVQIIILPPGADAEPSQPAPDTKPRGMRL